MSKVSKYSVLVYSGEQGYQNNRAQITLADSDGNSLAFVRFKDPGMPCELDTETDGIITMRDRARLPVCQAEACGPRNLQFGGSSRQDRGRRAMA